MKKLSITLGSTVEVIAGSEKGKKGTVLALDPKKMKIKVQGVKVMTKNDRQEGQLQQEAFINYSNVKLIEKKKAAKKKAAKK